ncbi:transcriptional coactivator PipX [Cyanobacterium sp. Dongsha4]|uniref:transcriptional coactivator PipX n=1 Tax=Cyanobacterium sp. DS4 TaxID=2878255 RepID=UPI002E80DF56|nr:PipX family protein [Cyanobacterium sp. Dongsha4]WVL00744.1 PipX family protein [Cyanobacterium sp. Dongsha4]
MSTEIYINHPNFGLLYRLCVIDKNEELFTTLYAQRLFFKVVIQSQSPLFEPLSRTEARILMENKLRRLRGNGEWQTYQEVNQLYQNTFQ